MRRIDITKKGDQWVAKSGDKTIAKGERKVDTVRDTAAKARKMPEAVTVKIHKETGHLSSPASEDLSKALAGAYKSELHPFFETVLRKYRGDVDPNERIGVFWWLRDIKDSTDDSFGLRFMSSSTYAHWEGWSAERVEPIIADSPFSAVRSVFFGQQNYTDIEGAAGRSQSWSGSFSWPVSLMGFGSSALVAKEPVDILTIGALTLNTTSAMIETSEHTPKLSVIRHLDATEFEELEARIYAVLDTVLP